MRIVAISDTHTMHRQIRLPPGDLLIHSGDATFCGSIEEVASFGNWFQSLPYKYKIFVPGNHDWLFQRDPTMARELMGQFHHKCRVLIDERVNIEDFSFYGTPWVPNLTRWAFYGNKLTLIQRFLEIPKETDILISHVPPRGTLDELGIHVGSIELADRIQKLNLKLHVFGHIHEAYGVQFTPFTSINASICDKNYDPVNKPIVLDLEAKNGITPKIRLLI